MGRCIFCKSESGPFTTREHILPESLGGGDWAILPDGLLCDACQNRFGSEVEQQALNDYPFSFFRIFLGVPTKKLRAPWVKTWEGTIRASAAPGHFGFDPAPWCEEAIRSGTKTQLRLLAHPLRPHMVCRTLLKMGLEVVASDNSQDVFNGCYDPARRFALTGNKLDAWWYLQREDMEAASPIFRNRVTREEWNEQIQLSISEVEDGAEMFHLRLLYLDMLVPLDQRIQPPPMVDLPEPEYRLFVV